MQSYKGFDLNANFNGVSGNKIYDNTANSYFLQTEVVEECKYYTGSNCRSEDESINNPAPVSTRYLKDGAYLRLNSLSLGYNFNTKKTWH